MRIIENGPRDELDKFVFLSMNLRAKRLNEIGLYKGQPIILKLIEDNPGLSQKEFADLANISKPTLNVMLNRLKKNKLVEIKHDDTNSKISKVYLTKEGKEKSKLACRIMQDVKNIEFMNLTEKEKELLYEILNKINNNIENEMKGEE